MTQHELDVICQNGEGQHVEFKRNINSDLSKSMVAFANAEGGRIFIGVDDGGKAVGVHIDNELKSRVETMARDCDPAVVVKLEVIGKILVVNVPEGKDKPYRSTNGFYVRKGASSVKLTTQELREFFRDEGKIQFDRLHVRSLNHPIGLDNLAIKRFTQLSGITTTSGRKKLLINLGVLCEKEESLILNNAGALFFGRNSCRYIPHAAISCVLFKGNKKVHIIDRKMLEFDLLTNIDQAVAFLERHLNLAYEIKEIRRKEILEIPGDVLREAIINAVAHRDYFVEGAHVVIEIFDNRVDISNPGGLPKKLKPENFGQLSVPRNPLIATLLNRCRYIEKAGTGIQRMRDGMKEAGLAKPIFRFSGFFTVTFRRKIKTETYLDNLIPVRADRLKRMYAIIQQLQEEEHLEMDSLAQHFNITERALRRDLEVLESYGLVRSSGATKNKTYTLTEEGIVRIDS